MNQTLMHWLAVCRLQAGPQDQVYSPNLLLVAVALNAGLSLLFLSLSSGHTTAVPQALLGTLVTLAFTYAALQIRGLTARFVQTATALFGANALLTAAAVPAGLALGQPQPEEVPAWAALWLLVIAVWTVAVTGHVFRHALNLSAAGGVGVAVLLFIVSIMVGQAIQ
ncbi:MAG: hypothetical protein JJU06_03750 [Ectothiorhodospiraceae bacterium]|nr:hypothetical protein [Ectothiorhodospiraceae bacterium]MCH8505554.1 hypothetical protein [Ectothiorhodospiraceae bacterium]